MDARTLRTFRLLVLPGDGIGPEVTAEAVRVLDAVGRRFGHVFDFVEGLIGASALQQTGVPLPDETLSLALECDATLLGAVGAAENAGPDDAPPELRPEAGLLGLRRALGVFANLRPIELHPALVDASPLRPERVEGTDLVIVRELCGGLYYGEPRGIEGVGREERAVDTLVYTRPEIERIAGVAFRLARTRRKKVTSVDKANVLASSRLWRRVVNEVARAYLDVELEHMLVDSCAMRLVSEPRRFDVILTENTFGDILSDEAAVLASSIGLLPSASLGRPHARRPGDVGVVGLFEPISGTAPDIAGQNVANPLGAIGAAGLLLEHGLGLAAEAAAVRATVSSVLAGGARTRDLRPSGRALTTSEMGHAVADALRAVAGGVAS